jgi:cysteine-rich repeat protein
MVETGEECDDGNFLNGDGCNIYCTKEVPSSRSSTSSTSSSPSAARPDGSICVSDKECESGLCSRGICRGNVLKIEDGGICNTSDQCIGLSCVNNKCTTLSSSSSSQPSPGAQTSFSLLQIRNLRVTTEGGSVFLAWEPLVSSQIKAYNVYYGATSGRYLQRKTVDAASSTITLRSLPQNTQYYFAVRALSNADEESAFSQEVGIVVGKPSTSTAPLTSNVMATKIESRSIVKVQGDTGLPIILTFALVLSAVIGTAYALKRQCTALSYPR